MRVISVILLVGGWLASAGAAGAQQRAASIEEILARVQTNTGQFVQTLPDFVCDEKVTSRGVHRGKLNEAVIESHFVGLQTKSGSDSFTERREVTAVNGRPAKRGQKFGGPFLFGGGFSSMLDMTFAPQHVSSHTYKIGGEEMLGGRAALVIEFVTKEAQKDLYFLHYGKPIVQNDTGKAWIDKTSQQVIRLERHYLNVPPGETPIVATVEYGEVTISGKAFWMPLTVRAEQAATVKHNEKGEYVAVYSNYRKFEVSSGIVFDQK